MHEIGILFAVITAIGFSIFIGYQFFKRYTNNPKVDRSKIAMKAVFLAFAVFVLLILYYENTREKKTMEHISVDCVERPADCQPEKQRPMMTRPIM